MQFKWTKFGKLQRWFRGGRPNVTEKLAILPENDSVRVLQVFMPVSVLKGGTSGLSWKYRVAKNNSIKQARSNQAEGRLNICDSPTVEHENDIT